LTENGQTDLLADQEESSPFECDLSCPEVQLGVSASSSSFAPKSHHENVDQFSNSIYRTFFVNISGFGAGLSLSPGAGMGIGC
jgi:hypothetical protein